MVVKRPISRKLNRDKILFARFDPAAWINCLFFFTVAHFSIPEPVEELCPRRRAPARKAESKLWQRFFHGVIPAPCRHAFFPSSAPQTTATSVDCVAWRRTLMPICR